MLTFSSVILPETDAAVYGEIALIVTLLAIGIFFSRKSKDIMFFIIGISILAFAFVALRSLH